MQTQLVFLLIGFLFLISACKSEQNAQNPEFIPEQSEDLNIRFNTEIQTISAEADSVLFIRTQGSEEYTILIPDSDSTWISSVKTINHDSLLLVISENYTISERRSIITLKTKSGLVTDLTIVQLGCHKLFFTQKELTVEADGGPITVDLQKTALAYHVILDPMADWLSLKTTRGLEIEKITLEAEPNHDFEKRIGSLVICDMNELLRDTLIITQKAKQHLIVSAYDYTVAAIGDTISFQIKSNVLYSVSVASENNEWITESKSHASTTEHRFQYTITDNPTSVERTGYIRIKDIDGKLEKTVTIKQLGKTNESGSTVRWISGFTVPEQWDEVAGIPCILERSGQGWYDVNKMRKNYSVEIGGDTFIANDYNQCWAMAASNLLHWWVDRNRHNIERYEKISGKEILTHFDYDITQTGDGLSEMNRSDIARLFRESFLDKPNRLSNALMWIVSGRDCQGKRPHAKAPAFFKDIIPAYSEADVNLITERTVTSREQLRTVLTSAFDKNAGIAITHSMGNILHVVTLYGAEFDDNGDVCAIYVADSDDNRHLVFRYGVGYDTDNLAYFYNTDPNQPMNKRPKQIYTLLQGQEHWNAYFNR